MNNNNNQSQNQLFQKNSVHIETKIRKSKLNRIKYQAETIKEETNKKYQTEYHQHIAKV